MKQQLGAPTGTHARARAQSQVVGVVLLTAVVVIAVGAFAALFLGSTGGSATDAPLVDADTTVNYSTVRVVHDGGDSVDVSAVDVIVNGDDRQYRFDLDEANLSGDGDGEFEPSETWTRAHGLTGPVAQIRVVHVPTSSVLSRHYLDVPAPTFDVQSALSPGVVEQGVVYEYYEAPGEYTALTDVDWSSPTRTGTTDQIDLDPPHRAEEFAFRYQTYLDVPADDEYTFYTNSDDGSVLYVDGEEVVDNRGLHPAEEQSGEIGLEAGYHNVTVVYFEHEIDEVLTVSYESETMSKQEIPASALSRQERVVRWETTADWDGVAAESGVVHESFGDRDGTAVELGYPTGGQWGPTPTAYWPFDEDSATTANDVVGTNDGAIQGATVGQPGTLGTTTYEFDGSDDYVDEATDILALRETASMSFWVKTTQTGDNTMYEAPGVTGVESDGDGNDVFWGWLDADGQIAVQAGDQPAATSSTQVNDDTWHHVVLTRDAGSGDVQVFVDGTLEDAATSRAGTVTTTFSSIGRIEDTAGTPEYFQGKLEDVQVYDTVLTQSEVTELADAGRQGSLTTGTKTFDAKMPANSVELQNVGATRPAGTTVTVTVQSDPDGDGTFEESSDAITLDGSDQYAVTGLSTESRQFRLVVATTTTDTGLTPTIDCLELGA